MLLVCSMFCGFYLCVCVVVSLYFKQKLRTQYVNALEDAKKELV